ncbi:MAG: glycosyltransferase family 2 protein [Clostridia bacterium]|nr:glycosyltransferase family 2 protein [Clostridia bacterium]
MNPKLYMVIPCYNEEEVLPETVRRLEEKYASLIQGDKISPDSRIVFVDDGSKDRTWELISSFADEKPFVEGIKLSRNRGHQNALLAGLMTVKEKCDISISMDADLQDDINAVDAMVDKYTQEGCDIVYGVRSSRKKDTFFKRRTALMFYRLMTKMGVEIVSNHADYRLMSKRALMALEKFDEVNLFLRGIVPLIGFKSGQVYYERSERFAGQSKYPFKKMLAFSVDGITSFSVKPIRLIFSCGLFIGAVSVGLLIWALVARIIGRVDLASYVSIVGFIALACGLQLTATGVVGEYIGKIYMESKHRPRFIIEEYREKTPGNGE